MLNNAYCKRVYDQILARDPDQKEFHQAVYEVLEGLQPMVERHPELEANGILERFVEPERTVMFRVPWTDDSGKVQVNWADWQKPDRQVVQGDVLTLRGLGKCVLEEVGNQTKKGRVFITVKRYL